MMKKNLYSMILVSALAFFSPLLQAQGDEDRFKKQLQPIIEQVMAQRNIPGFAIAIVQNRKVVYAAGFGLRNLEKKGDKVTSQSLFHMHRYAFYSVRRPHLPIDFTFFGWWGCA